MDTNGTNSPRFSMGRCIAHRESACPLCHGLRFVAVKLAVMRGADRVAVAVSHTMAKRIANALNAHKPNQRGE